YQPPQGFRTVFQSDHQQRCLESRLVLESVGIRSEAVRYEGQWMLIVSDADVEQSTEELASYGQERTDHADRDARPTPIYGGAVTGVVIYAGLMMLVAVLMGTSALGYDWFSAGRMQAGLVVQGQWWRTITALTLHLDIGHLSSNLVFGIVFGLLAGRVLGGGVAWLVILLAGSLGNLMNALVQVAEHTSIGASTSVFAALGVLVSHALRPSRSAHERPLKRWSPLIGGLLLLAFTGVGGERTDVTAHVTGFVAGLALGWAAASMPSEWLGSRRLQQISGIVAIALVVMAWTLALSSAG
ncbi:MAG: rhomboid family intramembrane serine protease, partial [Rubripirellula sp.]